MEDLLENFSKHINKLISSKLGSKIRNLARAFTNYRTEEDFSRLESNIQNIIESYLSNLKDNDYKEIAKNIFISFVEEDDKNLIKAINFYKRTYEHYQEMNLRRKFYKWRETALKLKMINNYLINEKFTNQNSAKNGFIKYNDKKILKYENHKKENNVNQSTNQDMDYYNFDNNFRERGKFNPKNNIIDKNFDNFFLNRDKYKPDNYNFNYENKDNDDEYKEENNEELDYNKIN